MKEYQSLSHTRWDCKYHVVFIPKGRKKRIFGAQVPRGDIARFGGEQGIEDRRGTFDDGPCPYLCISIPPKYAVSNVVGYIKGKSAIQIARQFGGRRRHFTGENFWARGYFVSTVGLDEAIVRAYIRHQESEDERYDQLRLSM